MSRWEVFGKNDNADTKYEMDDVWHYPFRFCVVGGTGTGKSNLIMNLLFNEFNKVVKRVVVIAGKPDTISEIKREFNQRKPSFDLELHRKYDDKKVSEIMDKLEEDPKETIFIFEDLMSFNVMKKQTNNTVDRIFQNGRSNKISTIVTAQKYMDLNKSSRSNNCSMLFLFEYNQDEIKQIHKDHNTGTSLQNFMEIADEHTREPYSFLAIDHTKPKGQRIMDKEMNVISVVDDDNDDIEVLEGKSASKSKPKAKKSSTAKQTSASTKKSTKGVKIKLIKFEKGDKKKMDALFEVAGKRVRVPFGDPDIKDYTQTKERTDRMKFLETHKDKKKELSNPLNPLTLQTYILYASPDLKRNIETFKEQFGV